MYPVVVSYYTKNTGYEDFSKTLAASCRKWKIPFDITPIPNLGSWERNCCYKAEFLLKKMDELNRPLLWIDADAKFLEKPKIFEDIKEDIALYIAQDLPDNHPSKMVTGTIFINASTKGKMILKEWKKESEKLLSQDSEFWDQVALRNVLQRKQASVLTLSEAYYHIYDKPEKDPPKIVHYQGSRTERKVINREVVPFWDLER